MQFTAKQHLIFFILAIVLPFFIFSLLSITGMVESISIETGVLLLAILLPLSVYYFTSYNRITQLQGNDILTSILFYVNFFIFMIMVLNSFFLIVVGGFLLTDQVPMGMNLIPENAFSIIIAGIYLLIISAIGMWYLSMSRKQMKINAI